MLSKGVHHVSLNAKDLAAAKSFYGDLLGLPEIERPELGFPGVWYQAGPVQLHIIVIPDGLAVDVGSNAAKLTPLSHHLAFAIDDYDAAKQRLEAAGHGVIGLGARAGQMFVADADGNTIELIRPTPLG